MTIILNSHPGSPEFCEALTQLAKGASTLSIGVSYVQLSGWKLLRNRTAGLDANKMRLVCTDQMNITQPAAIRQAMEDGVRVRNFSGKVTYHPKVIISHDAAGHPMRFLVGSTNLSWSALSNSVEAGILGTDAASLQTLHKWFNNLFKEKSSEFTQDQLRLMEERWQAAATSRAKERLRVRRGIAIPPGVQVPIAAEDLDAIEDVLSTIQTPIGLLNLDYAANNIRNINQARNVLSNPAGASSKQASELKLLGFMEAGVLTPLGIAAKKAASDEAFAKLWCKWLRSSTNQQLINVNSKLLAAKRVFPRFWRLQPEVRNFFLTNAQSPKN